MRSKRTNRKSLKAELERLKSENVELERLKSENAELKAAMGAGETGARCEPPPILSGGFPAKAAARVPKSLKEAKEILMSSVNW